MFPNSAHEILKDQNAFVKVLHLTERLKIYGVKVLKDK